MSYKYDRKDFKRLGKPDLTLPLHLGSPSLMLVADATHSKMPQKHNCQDKRKH